MTTTPRVHLDDFNTIPAPAIEEHDSWRPQDLTQLPETPPVQPTLGNLGLVYPGKRHIFSGPQESAKTLAAYAIALHIIRQNLEIILIDFEMGAYEARNRLRELGATHEDIQRIHYLEPDKPAEPAHIKRLTILQPALVLIDAAAGAFNLQHLDDNKRADVEHFTNLYVRIFWRAGIATIVLDHVVKNTENRGHYAIGSERKVGGADVHLGFETILPISRGTHGKYKIITHKDRGGFLKRGHLADLELRSDPVTHQLTWEFRPVQTTDPDEPFRPTHLMEKISRHLEPLTVNLSKNEISKQVRGDNNAKATAIQRLLIEGYCVDQGTNNESAIKSVKNYREDADTWEHLSASLHLSGTSLPEQSSSPLSAPSLDLPERGPEGREEKTPLFDPQNGSASLRFLDDLPDDF